MSIRKRLIGGGVGLGLAGLGLLGGSSGPASAACTPIGSKALCSINGKGPGYRSSAIYIGSAPSGAAPITGVALVCYNSAQGTLLAYAISAGGYTYVPLGTGLGATYCP